jgi:hypothetical protein
MRGFLVSRRPSPAMAVAFVALLAALSGTAVALPGKNTVDSADIKNGQVKGKDVARNAITGAKIANSSVTGADVRDGSLTPSDFSGSVQGPQGPQGLKGDKGDPGIPATKLWARVSGGGALVGGSGVVAVNRTAAGRYNVTFNQDVSSCAWISTSDFRGLGDGWGVHVDHGTPPDANSVRVLTSLNTASTVDEPFNVAVFC